MYNKRGFTLLEILMVISISAILMIGGMSSYSHFTKKKSLEITTQTIASYLKDARSFTIASKGDTTYGVHFEADRVVLFSGSSFIEPSADNREHELPGNIEISVIDLNGGGSDVVFDRLTGATSQYGTTTVSLFADITDTRDIVIEATGIVEF